MCFGVIRTGVMLQQISTKIFSVKMDLALPVSRIWLLVLISSLQRLEKTGALDSPLLGSAHLGNDSYKYHEDAHLSARELISKYGYRGETHKVTTNDGYILEMHRITGPKSNPKAEGKPVIFVMHGLLCSSVDWIISGPKKGLGFMLADAGYDVWLGNARGNTYSRGHKKYSTIDKQYWMFSWHEQGTEDLPAMIDYITRNTGNERIFYAAHSQGTTAYFVMASEKPKYNDKIIAMFGMAPVAYLEHMRSPFLQVLTRIDKVVTNVMEVLGWYEFKPIDGLIKKVATIACQEENWTQDICLNVMFLIAGFGSDQMNRTLLPAILGHTPAGSSSRQLIHYSQLFKSNKFRKYDHGALRNYIIYKRMTPPSYDLSKVTTPVIISYGLNDWLAHPKDVRRLTAQLPNVYAELKVPNPNFGHLDHLWGIDAPRYVYSKLIALLNHFRS
ncbi:lipase 3-like isoform X2 [Fopius arisanus]|uniref:Lip3_18 protein n=1 Tax=Fopius arisanus TaxID=64838 RepID=A0A0C9PRI9_9HYME|nr:PREDICTED: lipase 3-like isoform X2 [Fopius arisanus]